MAREFSEVPNGSNNLPLQRYNAEVHVGAFALPEFLRKAVGR